ncbi:MAG TPA: hypothetical protein VH436_11210 [Vicinamibacterales bacterium]
MSRSRLAGRIGLIVVACSMSSCAPVVQATHGQDRPAPRAPALELWRNPTDLAQRDLRWGPGRPASAPSASAMYTVVKRDDTGYSRGYDVVGPDKRKWSIKVGKEAQPEIVLSRILWALGYYQPETYYVKGWQLVGDWAFEGQPARFRLQSGHHSDGEWKWVDNPFAGSRAMHGLIAINLLLNNWDLKTSNNRVYRLEDPRAEPARRYVVQDLGASLGRPRVFPIPVGTRNDIDDFETTPLIKEVRGSDVVLNYRGRHGEILARLSVEDLVWASELMNRLSDAQLDDAFKAADYPPDLRRRYIAKIRAKIREGLALRPLLAARAETR